MMLACVVVGVALLGAPAIAQDAASPAGVEELGKRAKQPQSGESGGLGDSAVHAMMTYAFSLLKGPDGKPIDIDEGDQEKLKKYSISLNSARDVIRAATRSAYADICNLPDLGAANYRAMVANEKARNQWSPEQLQMIDALYLFAVSYFTGNAQIIEEPAGDQAANEATGEERVFQAPTPKCPPEQKQKVQSAINAYVASVQAQ